MAWLHLPGSKIASRYSVSQVKYLLFSLNLGALHNWLLSNNREARTTHCSRIGVSMRRVRGAGATPTPCASHARRGLSQGACLFIQCLHPSANHQLMCAALPTVNLGAARALAEKTAHADSIGE